MAIYYDFYPNPPRNDEEGTSGLHPRPVISEIIKSKELAEVLSARSSFSSADLKGMLDNLAYGISTGLKNSKNVHLEGLGTFSLSLESYTVKDSPTGAKAIRVKDIHFRADNQLKEDAGLTPIIRVKKAKKRIHYAEGERLSRILWYIDRYEDINITTTMKLNHCIHKKAKDDLAKLTESGVVREKTFGKAKVYFRKL